MTIVSKQFCSSYQATLVVRKRPNIVNGGGFVVIDSSQKVVFKVDGYDFLGKKEELFLKDGEGHNLLLIRRKGGLVEALSIYKQWRGYTLEFEGSPRPIFTVKQPNSCFVNQNLIKVSTDEVEYNKKDGSFEIKGCFADRACSIINSKGNVIAQIGKHAEIERVMATNELYHVVVKPGVDQAFVFGVIAVLDFIYEGSTKY